MHLNVYYTDLCNAFINYFNYSICFLFYTFHDSEVNSLVNNNKVNRMRLDLDRIKNFTFFHST